MPDIHVPAKKQQLSSRMGQIFAAKVIRDLGLTKQLPADLASPIGSRDLMIVVHLEPVEEIPSMFMIDGLPVSARYHAFDFISSWKSKYFPR